MIDNTFVIMKKKIMYLMINVINIYCIGLYSYNILALSTEPVLSVPSTINLIDWKPVLLKILQNVFFFDNIAHDGLLLVNMVKNDTDGVLQATNITNILINCIQENTRKYNVIDIETMYAVYRQLGVYPEDNRNSYNFAIKIANYLKANYILYSIAYGDSKKPNLELQLILVKTGEIVQVINGSV
ncbi:penicillin-binding protein activator LpoB [Blochmannia endosymbiont of Camponotus nipponensis]|uniref:penicillin-binding protein activator LpoB n=1 Tax=Blochmannia endosymbiont of Camponotus nipponensis TaxID=2681986 RepID=UPI00135AF6FE|nr:penicillin-binding protein activator LpoB [Blochmannia endosymbiont of Camponotus nipponensis]